jgi:hypothetical protein
MKRKAMRVASHAPHSSARYYQKNQIKLEKYSP